MIIKENEKEEWICPVLEVLVGEVPAALVDMAPEVIMEVLAAAHTWGIARLRRPWAGLAAGGADLGGPWAAAVASARWSLLLLV